MYFDSAVSSMIVIKSRIPQLYVVREFSGRDSDKTSAKVKFYFFNNFYKNKNRNIFLQNSMQISIHEYS